jgi:hypothetical protein
MQRKSSAHTRVVGWQLGAKVDPLLKDTRVILCHAARAPPQPRTAARAHPQTQTLTSGRPDVSSPPTGK